MTQRLLIVLALLSLVFGVGSALAENAPDSRLDAAASSIAGHPVTVYCEMSWSTWLANANDSESGFTSPPATVVYINPQVCLTLTMLLHSDDAGTTYAAQALLVLAHESVHQRGVTDEGVTDCTALSLVSGLATQFFNVPATVPQTVTASKTITVRIGKKSKRVTVTQAKTTTVPNPWLVRLSVDALRWHRAKPPAYQGSC